MPTASWTLNEAIQSRFWAKVVKGDGCWAWAAARNQHGYGQFRLDGRMRAAHRVAYELMIGPIPDGLDIDHLCRVRHCVNPAHLEPVTTQENVRRGLLAETNRARGMAITHCKHGHCLDGDNAYRGPDGFRKCRACHAERERVRRQRRAA